MRKLYNGKVLAGFAGATADAFTLFERFEAKLEKHNGHLTRAAIDPDQRLAYRPRAAPLSHARRRRSHRLAHHHRQWRRAGAGARPDCHWFGRRVCRNQRIALLHNTELAPEEIVKKSLEIPATSAFTPIKITPSKPYKKRTDMNHPSAFNMTPQEIVSELDKHIVG